MELRWCRGNGFGCSGGGGNGGGGGDGGDGDCRVDLEIDCIFVL